MSSVPKTQNSMSWRNHCNMSDRIEQLLGTAHIVLSSLCCVISSSITTDLMNTDGASRFSINKKGRSVEQIVVLSVLVLITSLARTSVSQLMPVC